MRVTDNSNPNNNNIQDSYSGQNTVKNIFLKLAERGYKQPEKHLDELSDFLNNLYHKKCLKSQINPQKAGAFGALWDGALVIVNTFDLDGEEQIKNADLSLLKEDLRKLSALL